MPTIPVFCVLMIVPTEVLSLRFFKTNFNHKEQCIYHYVQTHYCRVQRVDYPLMKVYGMAKFLNF